MRVSAAGNMPLQGLVKPPAKPVVMIVAPRSYKRYEMRRPSLPFLPVSQRKQFVLLNTAFSIRIFLHLSAFQAKSFMIYYMIV